MTYSDPEYVAKRYRDASNLNARVALHGRFNAYGLARWTFDLFEPASQGAIHITKDAGLFVARK